MERTPAEDLAILALIGGNWTAAEIHQATEESIEMIDSETGYHYWYDPQTGERQGTTAPWQVFVG